MSKSNSDFTEGSIAKKLAAFMMPILGALILQAAYGAVDLLVVDDSELLPGFRRYQREARY